MTPHYILLETTSPEVESVIQAAANETRHQVLKINGIREACRVLATDLPNITLAIIEDDLDQEERSVLRLLVGCEPDFPIVAIVSPSQNAGDLWSHCATSYDRLAKPISVPEVREKMVQASQIPASFDPQVFCPGGTEISRRPVWTAH